MATKLSGGVKGVDHIAYVTWNPAETIHFDLFRGRQIA